LSKYVEVIEYKLGSRKNLLFDVWKLWQLNADIYHVTGDVNYLTASVDFEYKIYEFATVGSSTTSVTTS
jgi:hypothetical protein